MWVLSYFREVGSNYKLFNLKKVFFGSFPREVFEHFQKSQKFGILGTFWGLTAIFGVWSQMRDLLEMVLDDVWDLRHFREVGTNYKLFFLKKLFF